MDRRHFIGIGGAAGALFGLTPAEAARSSTGAAGANIADWGIEPDTERDQSQAMQKAIDELASAGRPIVLPAGRYRVAGLRLPSRAAVFGIPGLAVLAAPPEVPVFQCQDGQDVSVRGVTFLGTGLIARSCSNLTIFDCQVVSSGGDGLVCAGSGLFVANNRIASCAKSGIWIEGDGIVTNNLVQGPGQIGLRLGGLQRLGTMTVSNNNITGTSVGIGASNADQGYALIMLNMISGAKNGGIRGMNGDELIGKDLTKGGSEAFRNLGIAANVSV